MFYSQCVLYVREGGGHITYHVYTEFRTHAVLLTHPHTLTAAAAACKEETRLHAAYVGRWKYNFRNFHQANSAS